MKLRSSSSILLLVLLLSVGHLSAQEKKAQAFRKNAPAYVPLVLPSTLDLQMLEAFILMQKANAGEAPAEHELGLRYLLGIGFPADTLKAALWIHKAAEQGLPIAQFNMGVLYMQGWGVEWNPYEAFKYYKEAADNEFPSALYVVGLMYTDNMIMPRDWVKAYRLIKQAVDLGFAEAKPAMAEIERRGLAKDSSLEAANAEIRSGKKSKNNAARKDTSYNLLFLDFHADTNTTIADTTLIRDAYRGINSDVEDRDPPEHASTTIDSSARSLFLTAAADGNPDALCLLGRCYERGLGVRKDLITAGVYYLRALHLDSFRAPALLWKLMTNEEFARLMEARSARNERDAMYVWSGLTSIGYIKLLNETQAFALLERAAEAGHLPSMVELGLCYFTGRWVPQDIDRAIEWWKHASALGSREADIRLAMANVLGQIHTEDLPTALEVIRSTAKDGALLSAAMLGYCYENGIGVTEDKGEAYRIYYKAMRRGSETAFQSVRRMYDQLRPAERQFQTTN